MDENFIKAHPDDQANQDWMGQRNNSAAAEKPKIFDAFSSGFELPAGTQLNRISKKLDRWNHTQNLIAQKKEEHDKFRHDLSKKEEKLDAKHMKNLKIIDSNRKEDWNKLAEKRDVKLKGIQEEYNVMANEAKVSMKQQWREKERDMRKKREKELVEQARLYEYYEGSKGAKAVETLKKAEALEDFLNEGEQLKREWLNRTQVRDQKLSEDRR